ncbi:MAG: class I SAM-dependent methyltransferase [Planctomycetes bacterium]|nr:class I SAM-dependent methyltransferase [Planctomycetota bacterium]
MRPRTFCERYTFRRDVARRSDSHQIRVVNEAFHDEVESLRYNDRWSLGFDRQMVADVLRVIEKHTGGPVVNLGRVLDTGAGSGAMIWAAAAADKTTFPVAQDISREMLKEIPSLGGPSDMKIPLVQADTSMLPFRGSSFDTVMANAVFHHLASPWRASKEILRVLAPGGRLLVSGEATEFFNVVQGAVKLIPVVVHDAIRAIFCRELSSTRQMAKRRPPDIYCFHPGELMRCVREAGFDKIRLETADFASALFRSTVGVWITLLLRPRIGRAVEEKIYRSLKWLDHRLLDRLLPLTLNASIRLSAAKPVCSAEPKELARTG